tara:strand:- start:1502 stop:1951 length:450 start_codon:yes stop_codon:yes gene_type:complete
MQKLIVFIILICIFSVNAFTKENEYFLMLKNNKVNVRYGPGFDYPIKFIYKKKYLPIKIIDKKENFRRIIDLKNNSGWIHTSQLRKNKSFILLEDQLLFSKPTKYSKPILKISKGRLLLAKKCKKKWCKVKTENYLGWIFAGNLWGSIN